MLCLIGVYSFSLGFLQYDLEPVSKEKDLLYVSLKDNSFVIFVVTTIIAKLFVVTSWANWSDIMEGFAIFSFQVISA